MWFSSEVKKDEVDLVPPTTYLKGRGVCDVQKSGRLFATRKRAVSQNAAAARHLYNDEQYRRLYSDSLPSPC